MAGVVPSEGFNEQLKRVVRIVLREERTLSGASSRYQPVSGRRKQGVLDGELAAASAFDTGSSTATMTVYTRDSITGDLTPSEETLTVTNRFENITVATGKYVHVQLLGGEWHVVAADCP